MGDGFGQTTATAAAAAALWAAEMYVWDWLSQT